MEPTLRGGDPAIFSQSPCDRIVVENFSSHFRLPKRGELIAFWVTTKSNPNSPKIMVRRIIGIQRDKIKMKKGNLFINGEEIFEYYLLKSAKQVADFETVVPDDCVFVLGDNRRNSLDSRLLGPINKDQIVGLVVNIYWPLERERWFVFENILNECADEE